MWVATLGKNKGQGIVYCGANCRAKAYRERRDQAIKDSYMSKIKKLEEEIKELKK